MNKIVFRTHNLEKKYDDFIALHPINITIEKGTIYGLIGNNGAGKTTLLRLITGQSIATTGDIEILGKNSEEELRKVRKHIGAIIETPSFFSTLTARQNLEYYRIQRGIARKNCISNTLSSVGLKDSNIKFKDFSLGMKQRLGLALTLMGSPELLILDEPTNGLDPSGMRDIRNLLLKLNEEKNLTIIISSHLLSELENLATFYGFLNEGKLVEQISARDLQLKRRKYIEIVVDNVNKATVVIEDKFKCNDYEVLPNNKILLYGLDSKSSELSSLLIQNGVNLISLNIKEQELENYYFDLVRGEDSD